MVAVVLGWVVACRWEAENGRVAMPLRGSRRSAFERLLGSSGSVL